MEERKMILKMIEEGKVTAEEGLKLLEAIGEEKNEEKKQSDARISESKIRKNEETALSTHVDWEKGGQQRTSFRERASTSFFTDFLGSAIQKIREFDLDFNFGSYVEIEHIFQHRDFTEKRLHISLENGSVTLNTWDEQDVRIECVAKVYRGNSNDEARHHFLQAVQFESDGNQLNFVTNTKSVKLEATIYIPKTMLDHVHFYSFNGHFKSEALHGDAVNLKVVNGSITLEKMTCRKLDVETVNGSIETSAIHAEDVNAKTMNGSIRIVGQVGDCDIETVNGTVHYQLEQSTEVCYADLKAATGSIYVKLPKQIRVDGKLKTNVGGFSCDLTNFEVVENKKEFIQKTVKFVSNKDEKHRLKLGAETNAGSIEIVEM